MSVLDQLYFGKLSPWETPRDLPPEKQKVKDRLDGAIQNLSARLSEADVRLLEDIILDRADLESSAICEAYKAGMRMGARLALELCRE